MLISEYNCAMARAAATSDVFNAIAEPQRRKILVLLRAGERPVTELAEELGMTQPGASKDRRVRAVLERELRPAGRVRPGPQADKTKGVTDGSNGTGRVAEVSDGQPRDRDLASGQCAAGAGVRGIHRSAAPVTVVGTGGVHHHY